MAELAAAELEASVASGALLKNAFQSVDCRTSMCRVEMLDDRSSGFFMQLNELVLSVAPHLPNMTGKHTKRPDGTAITIYYFSSADI